jgi:hypothetical protein
MWIYPIHQRLSSFPDFGYCFKKALRASVSSTELPRGLRAAMAGLWLDPASE